MAIGGDDAVRQGAEGQERGDGVAGDASAGDGLVVGVDDLALDLAGLGEIEGPEIGWVIAVPGDLDDRLERGRSPRGWR